MHKPSFRPAPPLIALGGPCAIRPIPGALRWRSPRPMGLTIQPRPPLSNPVLRPVPSTVTAEPKVAGRYPQSSLGLQQRRPQPS